MRQPSYARSVVFATAVLLLPALPAPGQTPPEPAQDVTDLAKKTQNPVGDLITVSFQFNFNTGGDLEDRTFFNLNFQPVIPFRVSANWNAIARTILPINSIPGAEGQRFSGVGDLQQQLFFTPAKPGAIRRLTCSSCSRSSTTTSGGVRCRSRRSSARTGTRSTASSGQFHSASASRARLCSTAGR